MKDIILKYNIIFLITIFITGCQGLQQIEQSPAPEPEPLVSFDKIPDSFNNYCEINFKPLEDSYTAASLSEVRTGEIITHTPESNLSDLWDILGQSFNIPVPEDKRVEHYKHWYLNNPHHIDVVTKRAKPFLFYFYEQIEQRGMPIELVLLPFVESSFDQFAYSHRGASGLWQITVPTGRTFGLEYLKGYDGRRDITASTVAALDLLEYLNKKFSGNWLHAIAAYNTGEGRVRRAIKANKSKGKPIDFWSLQLPRETQLYVPKLLAMADLVKHRYDHDLKLAFIKPEQVLTEVVISNSVKLDLIASHAGLTRQALYALNPGYTNGYTSPGRDNKILIPSTTRETFYNNKKSYDYVKGKFSIHHIQPGESLSELALLNNTTVARIKNANDMSGSTIFAGQQLLIPQH